MPLCKFELLHGRMSDENADLTQVLTQVQVQTETFVS